MKLSTFTFVILLISNWVMAQNASFSSIRSSKAMIMAAQNFVASLPDSSKIKLLQKFDDALRMDWEFYPRPRKGLALKSMTPEQRILAHAFLKTGLSSYGYLKANTIMGMEPVLKQIEEDANFRMNLVRDQENYFIAIWGTPAETGAWAWRIEGHHVSVHLTMADGKLIANTPLGFGSSPAEIRKGPRAGFRTFAFEEDLGRDLVMTLDKNQQSIAILNSKITPGDMMTMAMAKVEPIMPTGIAYTYMTKNQQDLLFAIIGEYLGRMPLDIAAFRLNKIMKEELKNLHFAWYGGLKKGEAHYYRIQGKSFIVEYDNSQTQANHVHSAWRDFDGDFGYDWLKEHLKNDHKH